MVCLTNLKLNKYVHLDCSHILLKMINTVQKAATISAFYTGVIVVIEKRIQNDEWEMLSGYQCL